MRKAFSKAHVFHEASSADTGEPCGKLFPDLSDEELEEAAQNQDDYLELAWEVFEELPPEKKTEVPMPKKRVDSIYRRFDSSPGCS